MISDMKLPGMLHARLLTSPLPHARLKNLDVKKALALPGVKAVVTAADCAAPQPDILARELVMHHGQAVAAVAASDPQIAARALELIEAYYEELPAIVSMDQALAQGADLVHADRPDNLAARAESQNGDLEKAFASASLVLEDSFSIPGQCAVLPEPVCCLAQPAQKRLTLWSNTNSAQSDKARLARALGLDETRVNIKRPYKQAAPAMAQGLSPAGLCTALLAQKTGRAVRLALTRQEEACMGARSTASEVQCRLGFDAGGLICALDMRIDMMAGAHNHSSGLAQRALSAAIMTYKIPAHRCEARLIYGHLPPAGDLLGLEGLPAVLAMENLMNRAADELNLAPLAWRQKNLAQDDLAACLQKLGELSPAADSGLACFCMEPAQADDPPLCGAAALQAELNPQTGQLRAQKVHMAHNLAEPTGLAEALGLGLGAALCEELLFDQGRVQNPSLENYRLAASLDLPELETSSLAGHSGEAWPLAALLARPCAMPCPGRPVAG